MCLLAWLRLYAGADPEIISGGGGGGGGNPEPKMYNTKKYRGKPGQLQVYEVMISSLKKRVVGFAPPPPPRQPLL